MRAVRLLSCSILLHCLLCQECFHLIEHCSEFRIRWWCRSKLLLRQRRHRERRRRHRGLLQWHSLLRSRRLILRLLLQSRRRRLLHWMRSTVRLLLMLLRGSTDAACFADGMRLLLRCRVCCEFELVVADVLIAAVDVVVVVVLREFAALRRSRRTLKILCDFFIRKFVLCHVEKSDLGVNLVTCILQLSTFDEILRVFGVFNLLRIRQTLPPFNARY